MPEKLYSQYINRLIVPEFTDKGFNSTEDNVWHLNNLKPINIFIGANNSGKSRLIRHLFCQEISSIDSDKYPALKYLNMDSSILPTEQLSELIKKTHMTWQSIEANYAAVSRFITNHFSMDKPQREKATSLFRSHAETICRDDDRIFISNYKSDNFKKTYIPLLRGLRTLRDDTDDFKDRTINDYFTEKSHDGLSQAFKNIDIFTGHSLYNDLKKSLLSTYEEREKVRDFEIYLSKVFFNNQRTSLIPRVGDNVVYLKVGIKDERPIYDLGDGLQAIIILTFKVFMATEPTMFFIEEPEQHLHASMQRSLIEAFSSHPEHMYFLTTHSNHIIDLSQETDDVGIQRIYQQFNNDHNTEITVIESLSKDARILADLGVRASSVLLANCSIWVEGITDKLYLRAYMSKFIAELDDENHKDRADKLRNYKENLHYIFTEYQGSNITHWDFSDTESNSENTTPARSVTSNIMLIADEDIDGKGDRVTDLTEALGDRFVLLNVKEIENLIPELILQKTAEEQWEGKNNRKKYSATFSAQDINQIQYSNTIGIGFYLEELVTKTPPEDAKKEEIKKIEAYSYFAEKSGTIKAKVAFCNIAIKHMNDAETTWKLTPTLTALCEKIWSHIESSNG